LFDHVESFMDLTAQLLGVKIAALEDGLDRLAQFSERLVGGVLHIVFGEAPQDGFRFRRPQADCRGVLDHLIVLLTHQIPVDRPAEDQLQLAKAAAWPVSGR
jgi:hypothetical protein